MFRPDVAKSLPCWLSQFSFSKLRQPTGQRLSNVRMQQTKMSIVPILFLCNMRKVWCHQIWIQNILVFMVLILMYVWLPTISSPKYSGQKTFSHQPIKTLENWQKKETSISSNFIHSRNVQIDNLYYWARFQWWANFWLLYFGLEIVENHIFYMVHSWYLLKNF